MTFLLVLLTLVVVNVLIVAWFYQWGIAKGRLLERRERVTQRAQERLHREVRRLSIVSDETPRGAA